MLRGHGTLKSLLGRSVAAQKSSGAPSSRRDPAGRAPSKRFRHDDISKDVEDDGLIRCPLCTEVLDSETADAHVGVLSEWLVRIAEQRCDLGAAAVSAKGTKEI